MVYSHFSMMGHQFDQLEIIYGAKFVEIWKIPPLRERSIHKYLGHSTTKLETCALRCLWFKSLQRTRLFELTEYTPIEKSRVF